MQELRRIDLNWIQSDRGILAQGGVTSTYTLRTVSMLIDTAAMAMMLITKVAGT